jgi:hypothetical protein
MNTLEGNTALATRAATTSPISEPRFEPAAKPPAAVSPAPVLITEKEVLFSTTAAVPLRPTTTRWWPKATGVLLAAMHQTWLASRTDARQPRQDYPKRYEFLERSCMAREMDRL